tara:strand:+ start:1677 stop:2093 length:417 start_codon:yes stop_codon:yes gene_type:complete
MSITTRLFTPCALALTLVACATGPTLQERLAELTPEERQAALAPLICDDPVTCAKYWRRAQAWIIGNSGMKVQTATEMQISTFNALSYSTVWAYTARREPLEGAKERIWLTPSCGQTPLCGDNPYRLILDFKRYVASK